MPGTLSQILHLPSSQLNTIDMASPGESSLDGGTGAARFRGQLGARLVRGPNEVRFDSAIGTLHGGIYQLVLTKAASTIAPKLGRFCFWDETDAASIDGFSVTPDDPGGTADVAGVYISAPTKGNHCIIQVAGIATVQAIASLSRTAGIGDVFVLGTNQDVDNIDSNDAINGDNLNAVVAIAIELPVNNTLTLARLVMPRWNF